MWWKYAVAFILGVVLSGWVMGLFGGLAGRGKSSSSGG